MTWKVPLAWHQLTKHKGRLFAAASGITFAVILVLVELGFQNALYTSITLFYSHFDADLVLISPSYQCIVARETFPLRRLYQALSLPQVLSIAPIYMETLEWTNPITRRDRFILAIGFRPRLHTFDLPGLNSRLEQIDQPGYVVFDEGSRSEFGPIGALFRRDGVVTTDVSTRPVRVAGLFRVGASFASSGQIITSDTNLLRLMPGRSLQDVDIGLINLKRGSNTPFVRKSLAAMLPGDVTVLTKKGLLDREKSYWAHNLPIGFLFQASLILGLIVGAVIVYQILYGGVSEHLAEFATLKAIGYTNFRLFSVVMQEAIILSVLGFIPGVLLGEAVYKVVRTATFLPVEMTAGRVLLVYPLIALMCCVAGLFAMRRLRSADPADIF